MCEDYLKSFHKRDIIEILRHVDIHKHFSLNIDFLVLYEHQPDLVVTLLNDPEKCLEDWENATLKAQMTLLKEADQNSQLKNCVHCRIYNLPFWPAVRRSIFPGNNDAGKFLQISGTVMRITAAKLLEFRRSYICVKCKRPSLVKAEYDRKYIIKQPKKCDNPEGCTGTNLVHFGELDSENCRDYQEIKIQEQIKKLGVSSMPNTIWVTLEDDLVDSCKPGDNVTICGIVKRRWSEFDKGRKIDIDLVFKANHVQVDNSNSSISASTPEIKAMFKSFWEKYADNPLEGRDSILKSFCPQIYGLYLVKLAIAVVLAGGSHMEDTSTGVRTRSEPHLILVGDPGTGKSQLLRFASKIIPRSVLTTGVGSTAAGLTVTATMEHGEWQLEGGALVMADGGICCIDEFNSMKEHDRTCIHEAMEQQTISVAKASMVCKLNTRCSILAACNPKGNLDPSQPLCMNIALPSPLLSRFDLILLLRDTVNKDWDDRVADYILNGGGNFSKLTDGGLWSTDILQTYFVTIKKLHPKLSKDAETILGTYYQMQRRIDNRNKARTTVRLLESLVRLSQGHARLMCHESVQIMDSIYAIILVDAAMDWDSAILNLNVTLNSVFPERPIRDYRSMLEMILNKLQLHQILDKEVSLLNKSKSNSVQSRFFNQHNSVEDGMTKEPLEDDPVQEENEGNSENTRVEFNQERGNNLQESRLLDSQNPRETVTKQVIENILVENRHEVTRTSEYKMKESSKSTDNSSTEIIDNLELRSTNTKQKAPKLNKSRFINSEVDEGYDTVSFYTSHSKNNATNNFELSTKNRKTVHEKSNRFGIFSGNQDDLDFFDILDRNEPGPSKGRKHKLLGSDSCVSEKPGSSKGKNEAIDCNAQILRKDLNSFVENIDTPDPTDISRQQSSKCKKIQKVSPEKKSESGQIIRSKLMKFKFVRKNDDSVVEGNDSIQENLSEHIEDTNSSKSKENSSVNNIVLQSPLKENSSIDAKQKHIKAKHCKRKSTSCEDSNDRKIKKKSSKKDAKSSGAFASDLQMLELMPGVNDDFNIDLDIDWEESVNELESSTSKKTEINNSSIGSDDFSKLSQNSKLKSISRFSSNSKKVKKLYSDRTSSSDGLVRSESATSSQRAIFESSVDNLDDINFDL